jgi:hypothetical protein
MQLGVRFRGSVEAFGGLVASYSQNPLACRYVNLLELRDELHDPAAVAGDRPVLAEENQTGRPRAVAEIYADPKAALADIETAEAAYGTVPAELFARVKKLRWICASRAALGGAYFYDALVKSDVVVTGMHGSCNEHLSTHAVAFLLAFARRFEHYRLRSQHTHYCSAHRKVKRSRNSPGCYVNRSITQSTNCSAVSIVERHVGIGPQPVIGDRLDVLGLG